MVLVVGSNGFLGNNLCKELFLRGNTVIGAYNNSQNNLFNKISNIQIDKLLNVHKEEFKTIYITSAFIAYTDDGENIKKLFESNVSLVNKLCKKYSNSKFIYCSSVSVFKKSNEHIRENSPISPSNSYGISKLWGENIIKLQKYYAIARISSMYGNGMNINTFLPKIIDSAINLNNIVLFGNGSREQNYIHVSDVINYLCNFADYEENGVFLVTSKKSYSNKELANKIINIIPKTQLIYKGEDGSPSYIYNNKETNKRLKIEPKVDLNSGLASLIEWKRKLF